ncbi:hypothetical protein [Nonomuraea sp. NPDC023979]|uniref:hypothetical protein n=1 Tax=Nonomuraea sp. NPDC023979 TaxID=3154796 RepID=UPI0033FCD3AE
MHRAEYGEEADWSTAEYLLALIGDHIAAGNWLFAEVHKEQGVSNPEPEPIPRPNSNRETEPEPVREFATPEQIMQLLATVQGG